MHLLAEAFQDCGHLNWRIDEVKYVGISSCTETVRRIWRNVHCNLFLIGGIKNTKLYNYNYKNVSFAHNRIKDEGEAKRVEPLQKAPAICSISI